MTIRLILFFLCSFHFAYSTNFSLEKNHQGFEENKGQVQGDDSYKVRYFLRKGNLKIFLLNSGISYQFQRITNRDKVKYPNNKHDLEAMKLYRTAVENSMTETYRMDLELIGANMSSEKHVEGKSTDYTNYYNYSTLNVYSYSKVVYENVYPNIDWVILTDGDGLKYEFVVRPGGNPALIKLKAKWVEHMQVSHDGGLTLHNRLGFVKEQKPISYQLKGEQRESISTQFVLSDNQIEFNLASYDRKKTLIIDPILEWATYYGGTGNEYGGHTSIDKLGNVFLSGNTSSTTLIASGGYQNTKSTGTDAFLVKFNSNGVRQWATYYGGSGTESGTFCLADTNNNVFLAGGTSSPSGIATTGAHQTTIGGASDAFIVKFNSAGTRQWATYYGGGNNEQNSTICIDTGGNIYLSGTTESGNNIYSTGGFQNSFGGFTDAYLAKFNSTGVRQWGTYYGGTSYDYGGQCAVDKSGRVYLCGTTRSTTNISGAGYQNTLGGIRDGFLAKFNPNGTRVWATYYGGSSDDYGHSVSVDTNLNVFISGFTYSTSDIASGGFQNTFAGSNDAYLVKFNSAGARQWATYYGGTNGDYGPHCNTDKQGNVYLAGYTLSTNSVAFGGLQNAIGGNIDGFVAKFSAAGTRYWATYYGKANDDYLFSTATDGFGNLFYSGYTLSDTGIASAASHQDTFGGGSTDLMLIRMSEDPTPYIEIISNKGDTICQGDTVSFTENDLNGGSAPKYRWFLNGTVVDTTTSYTAIGLNSGDTVQCLMISNAVGVLYDSAWSFKIIFHVHPIQNTSLNINICKSETYYFKGQNRDTTGVYIDSLQSYYGCDSFVTLNLNVGDTSNHIIYDTICSNQSYTFKGLNLTSSGLYKDTMSNAVSCDSFIYLHLLVKQVTMDTIDTAICPNQSYFFNGISRTTAGTYKDTVVNAEGCDSFIILNLTVKTESSTNIDSSICPGDSVIFKGVSRYTAGIYRDTLPNTQGCDSIITLSLTLKNVSTKTIDTAICDNQYYVFKGQNLNLSGQYRDTLSNAIGCDSIVILNLTVQPRTYSSIFDTICSNGTYVFDGQNINLSGIYRDTLVNSNNCDSIVTLNLYVIPVSNYSFSHNSCVNTPYLFNSQSLTASGVYLDTLVNSEGCDSFVTLNLIVSDTTVLSYSSEICIGDSVLFKGIYRKSSGLYLDTAINSNGCDSFIRFSLMVRDTSSTNLSVTRCANNPYFFNGNILTSSGLYKDTLVNQYSCDSFINLNYILNDTSSFSFNAVICDNDFYVFDGIPRTTSDQYQKIVNNSLGCDSTVVLNLLVHPSYTKLVDTSLCLGESINFKGQSLSSAGTYVDSLKSVQNCDSFVVLQLSIQQPTSNTIYQKFCNNNSYYFNGNDLTSPGRYEDTLTNYLGCDSFLSLVLYIDSTTKQEVYDTICYSDSVLFGGKYLTEAGVYDANLKTKGGCDSLVKLHLTKYPKSSVSISKFNESILIANRGFSYYQWYMGGSILNNEIRYYLEVPSSGLYSVYTLDSNKCPSWSNEISFSLSSLNQSPYINSIQLFPMPVEDVLYIKVNASFDYGEINIFSLDGKLIQNKKIESGKKVNSMDVSNLDNGLYFLKIKIDESEHYKRLKILKRN